MPSGTRVSKCMLFCPASCFVLLSKKNYILEWINKKEDWGWRYLLSGCGSWHISPNEDLIDWTKEVLRRCKGRLTTPVSPVDAELLRMVDEEGAWTPTSSASCAEMSPVCRPGGFGDPRGSSASTEAPSMRMSLDSSLAPASMADLLGTLRM